jgi:hypothetical protein
MTLAAMLGGGSSRSCWERGLLLALALQARSASLLLGLWLAGVGVPAVPLWGRVRVLPAHPDWYLAALAQSLVVGLGVAWFIRRRAIGWAVSLAALAGGLAWGCVYSLLPTGAEGFALVFVAGAVERFVATTALLVALAVGWRLLGRWPGTGLGSVLGGLGSGTARLLLTYSVFGAAWPPSWRVDLALEVGGAGLLGLALAWLLPTIARSGSGSLADGQLASPLRVGALAVQGQLVMAFVYLELAYRYAGWTPRDALWLMLCVAALALVGLCLALGFFRGLWATRRDWPAPAMRSQVGALLLLATLNVLWFVRLVR